MRAAINYQTFSKHYPKNPNKTISIVHLNLLTKNVKAENTAWKRQTWSKTFARSEKYFIPDFLTQKNSLFSALSKFFHVFHFLLQNLLQKIIKKEISPILESCKKTPPQ